MLQFLKDLFKKQEDHNVPFIQEELKRDTLFLKRYETWKSSGGMQVFEDYIFQAYHAKKRNPNEVTILETPSSNGFILYPSDKLPLAEYSFYLDYLKEKVLPLGYRKYMSDLKQYARKEYAETIERHYLKPRLTRDPKATKANQQYGNISIELTLHNEEAQQLKFLCNSYRDQLYSEALPFSELMGNLLE